MSVKITQELKQIDLDLLAAPVFHLYFRQLIHKPDSSSSLVFPCKLLSMLFFMLVFLLVFMLVFMPVFLLFFYSAFSSANSPRTDRIDAVSG